MFSLIQRVPALCLIVVFLTIVVHAQAPPAIQWARVPAGSFQMGCISADAKCDADEHPRHAVTISRAFDLMTTEVTAGMYRAAVKEVDEQPAWSKTPDQPIVIVTWDEAVAFCQSIGGRCPPRASGSAPRAAGATAPSTRGVTRRRTIATAR